MSIYILGIETSCDETSVAVLEDGVLVRANIIASQAELHQKFGGVVPEVASRRHLEVINTTIQEALSEARLTLNDIHAVAVTRGPGLAGALLVGLMAAKTIALARNVPLLGINHLEAHIYANLLANPRIVPPMLCLIVSGGHTDLVSIPRLGDYRLLGQTRDDAAGEAFDKVARVLNLPYPGGPNLENLARRGDRDKIHFPRSYLERGTYDFSFSGLKTAVITYLEKQEQVAQPFKLADVAAGFQEAVVQVLTEKLMQAAHEYKPRHILLAGGVAANKRLATEVYRRAEQAGFSVTVPSPEFCTDNAAMVACAGYYRYLRGDFSPLTINAVPRLRLEYV